MRKWLFVLLFILLAGPSWATVNISAFVTPDDVTIAHLEEMRTELSDEINSFPGSSIQTGSIAATKLDADANPHNRWNEAFNDFVYTGLTIPTTVATLTGISDPGIAYINGVRVVKDATSNLYTGNRDIYVDLSDNGVFTYTTVTHDANGSVAPAVAVDSIRLARVSTDTTKLQYVEDLRVTTISLGTNSSAIQIADADNDTKITTQFNPDEDILRMSIGNATLTTAKEAITIQAIDTTNIKVEPGTDNIVDLGSSSKQYRNAWIKGTATVGTLTATNLTATNGTITNLTASSATIGGGTPSSAIFTSVTMDNLFLNEQGSDPTTAANVGALYTKDVAGNTELYWRDDSNGTPVQMTNAGQVLSGLTLKSTTTVSGAADTGTISLTSGKAYKVIFYGTDNGGGGNYTLRFNGDSGANYNVIKGGYNGGAAATFARTSGATSIQINGTTQVANGANFEIELTFMPEKSTANNKQVSGTIFYTDSQIAHLVVGGNYTGAAAVTSFIIAASSGNTTGTVLLYEYSSP